MLQKISAWPNVSNVFSKAREDKNVPADQQTFSATFKHTFFQNHGRSNIQLSSLNDLCFRRLNGVKDVLNVNGIEQRLSDQTLHKIFVIVLLLLGIELGPRVFIRQSPDVIKR